MSLHSKMNGIVSRRGFLKGTSGAAVSIALVGCAGAKTQESSTSSNSASKLAIIHTNDSHGHDLLDDESLGLAAVAQLKTDWKAKGYEVLLMDAGDATQGNNLVNCSEGDTAISFMNDVGYDVMALGNHEFDYGQDKIADYVKAATFPILSANTIVDDTGETLVDSSCVFTLKDGRKVGVFGLTTPETSTKASPLLVHGLSFKQEKELYTCAQEQVDDLKQQGCDLVVCIGHLGEDDASAPNRAQDVVENVSGIDLFIDGHDHMEEGQTLTDASGNHTLVVEAECYTHRIGIVTWEDGKLEQQMVKYGEYNGQDATIAATIQKVADDIDEALGVVVGSTAFLLNGERDPGVRTKETNLGDFVADALLWDAQQSSDDSPQCAIANGGSIRSSVEEGDITYGNILDVCPYINYLCTIQVTGSQLLEAIEASCSSTPEELGAFPQVSGMEFTIDTTVSYEEGDLYPDSTYHAPANPGSRVTIHTVDGAPFDENSTYTIAASDFLCAGGDTYYVFAKAAENTMQSTEHLVYDSIRNYLEKGCGSIVGEQYAESQERIKIAIE